MNASSFDSSSDQHGPPHRLVLPVGFALFAALVMVGVCGNSILVRAIARHMPLVSALTGGYRRTGGGGRLSSSTPSNAAANALLGLLLQMAIANLVTTSVPLPLSLLELVLHRVGAVASLVCHVAQLTFLLCFVLSACLQVAIVLILLVPRFQRRLPLAHVHTARWRLLMAISWIVASLSAAPMLYSMLRELVDFMGRSKPSSTDAIPIADSLHFCLSFQMSAHQLYFSVVLLVVFLLCSVILLFAYTIALSERRRALESFARLEYLAPSQSSERPSRHHRSGHSHSAHSHRTASSSHYTSVNGGDSGGADASPAVAAARQLLSATDSNGSVSVGWPSDPEAEWRTARTLSSVAILYFVCWAPLVFLLLKSVQVAPSFLRSETKYTQRFRSRRFSVMSYV